MITLNNTFVYGWEAAIRGMRNPMNSWDKSDSGYFPVQSPPCNDISIEYVVGKNDFSLMKKLVNAGSDHSKFMRMITVSMDVTAPLYWWKEYDTYKVGTVANSCSTMHKIHAKEFTLDDFSTDRLYPSAIDGVMLHTIRWLNFYRDAYLISRSKTDWDQLIQLLPSSYNQRRTIHLNYAVLRNIYHSRRNHKLTEWHTFCDTIRSLPYSELITGGENPCTTQT